MAAAYEEILKKIQEGLLQKEEEKATPPLLQAGADGAGGVPPSSHTDHLPGQTSHHKPPPPPSPSFKVLYDNICSGIRSSGLLDTIMKDFQELKTDLERVQYIAQMNEVQTLCVEENYSRKSEEDASNYEKVYDILIPNEASASKALEVMKKCVMKTPAQNTTALAVRYMKRGWASLLLEQFDDARTDAKKSLSFHCPEELVWNSFEILGYCSARLHDYKAAESYFLTALENLRKSNITNEVKATVTGRVMTVFKTVKAKKNKKASKNQSGATEGKPVPQVSYGTHKTFPSASSALDFLNTHDRGRCTVAKKDIKPGDILMVDAAYCSMINPEFVASHCYQCYSRSPTPVPCPSCAKVSYCSEACQVASWTGLHKAECRVLNHLINPDIGKMALLSYRVLTTVTWPALQKWRQQIDKLVEDEAAQGAGQDLPPEDLTEGKPEGTPLAWQGKYSPRDYKTVLHLVTNSTKRTFGDLFKRTITAVYLTHCLKTCGYFGGSDVDQEDLLFVASLVLRHLQGSSSNAYEISEFKVGPEGLVAAKMLEVGGALYTTVSLTNHSCVANTTRYSVGDKCILRAIRSIPKGSEVFDNYGFHFNVSTVNERQEVLLNQYKFKCCCEACRLSWPLYPHHTGESLIFRCPAPSCQRPCCYSTSSRNKCNMCGNQQQYTKLLQELEQQLTLFKDALDKLKKGQVSTALPILLSHQAFLDRYVVEPVKHYSDTQEATKQCYNYLGNVNLPRQVSAPATTPQRPAQPRLKAAKKQVILPH
ncbi:SET and MYND domain-containing protein 4-like [Panulirus ornatus]|uniref:SET and MYND domain-containing protein 4-like n=1 Tax=Panulirus ornatus TaxID=150431 RepID=UPI003A88EE40